MNRHITAETLLHCITESSMTDEKRLAAFTIQLQNLCNTNTDCPDLFRVLNHTRIRLLHRSIVSDKHSENSLKIAIGYIDTELELLARYGMRTKPQIRQYRWTGTLVELTELIYGLQELHCIDDGDIPINELFAFFGGVFGMDMKESHCYNAYADMKRRKNDSRTYFLDKMRERLNLRMQCDDEKERERRK